MRATATKVLLGEILMLTDTNQHTEARVVIATAARDHVGAHTQLDRLLVFYDSIQFAHRKQGHLTLQQCDDRRARDGELKGLMAWAWENWQEVWNAL